MLPEIFSESSPLLADFSSDRRHRAQQLEQYAEQGIMDAPKQFLLDCVKRIRNKLTVLPHLEQFTAPFLAYELAHENDDEPSHVLVVFIMEIFHIWFGSFKPLFTAYQEHSFHLGPVVAMGQSSATALAASTIANMVSSIVGYSTLGGFTSALEYVLKPNTEHHVAMEWLDRTLLACVVTFIPIALLFTESESLFRLLNLDLSISTIASDLLHIILFALPAFAACNILKHYLRAQNRVNIYRKALFVVTFINGILTYLLVDGPVPSLSLGPIGAPLCTSISYNLTALFTLLLMWWSEPYETPEQLTADSATISSTSDIPAINDSESATSDMLPSQTRQVLFSLPNDSEETLINTWHPDTPLFDNKMCRVLELGFGAIAKTATVTWPKDISALAISLLGQNALSCQTALHVIASTTHILPHTLNETISSRITFLLGKQHFRRCKILVLASFINTLIVVFLLRTCLLSYGQVVGHIFSSDSTVSYMITETLPVIALFQFVHGVSAWGDCMLRGFGQHAVYAAVSASADLCIGIPFGLWLAFQQHWGLEGIWTGLVVSQCYACVVTSGMAVIQMLIEMRD